MLSERSSNVVRIIAGNKSRESMANDGGPLVEYGRRRLQVRSAVAFALNTIEKIDQAAANLLKDTLVQGKGDARESMGTHLGGFAVDFSLKDARWDRHVLYYVVRHLEEAGFAVAVRHAGELSPNNPAHIHAALIPWSNSGAMVRARRWRPIEAQINDVYGKPIIRV